jgi:dipeptidyl aminopeptidase/acylaminoacyl peptidase
MPFVDTDNAIAAGASYGGYMANWIQGNALGRKFKAIVCHDGVFGMRFQYLWCTTRILTSDRHPNAHRR